METATQPPWQPSSLFVILRSYAVVGRVALAFWRLLHLCPAMGRRLDPSTRGEAVVIFVSFCFQLGGIANLGPRVKVRGNTGEPPLSDFFSFRQCFLSFIQCFLPCVQFRFPLNELLFSGRIMFLAGSNHRKRDEHRKGKKFFHIRSKLYLVGRTKRKAND